MLQTSHLRRQLLTRHNSCRRLRRTATASPGRQRWKEIPSCLDIRLSKRKESRGGVSRLRASNQIPATKNRSKLFLPVYSTFSQTHASSLPAFKAGCVGGSEPEDGGVQVAGYNACILGYDPTYSTFGSSSCGFAGGSSIESCAPGERGFGIRYGVITPAPAFNRPGEAFSH